MFPLLYHGCGNDCWTFGEAGIHLRAAGQSGGYYVKRQRREPSAAARDDDTARKLWEVSQELTGLASARPGG